MVNTISFKKMTEDDFKLLFQWFQIPHVFKWYARNKKFTLEMIREKYLPRLNNSTISNFIIFDDNYPVGYIQLYHLTHYLPEGITDYNHPIFNHPVFMHNGASFKPEELVGIDLFIADEKSLRKGLGSRALKIFLEKHIKGKFSGVLVDPLKENSTAISFFELNGFKHIVSQDNKHDLMLLTTATKNSHSMNDLITIYKQRFNLENASFSRIKHEDAIIATVFKVSLPDGREYILKISTRKEHYLCELYFLKYFANKLPVPQIIKDAEPTANMQGAILMEFLPGTLLKLSEFTDSQAFEIGSLLATTHANKVAGYGDLTQPDNLSSDPSHYFSFKFEEGLTECSQHLPNTLLEQCRRYYDSNIKLLSLVDGPCITHRDFRPGNVIVNEGKIQGVIDWAGGRASFAEEDFCPLEFGEWSNNKGRKKAFLKGYASIRSIPNYENIMPFLRLSRAIATIGFTIRSNTWETLNANLYRRNRQFLDKFFKTHF